MYVHPHFPVETGVLSWFSILVTLLARSAPTLDVMNCCGRIHFGTSKGIVGRLTGLAISTAIFDMRMYDLLK